jgi:hypothetical protein
MTREWISTAWNLRASRHRRQASVEAPRASCKQCRSLPGKRHFSRMCSRIWTHTRPRHSFSTVITRLPIRSRVARALAPEHGTSISLAAGGFCSRGHRRHGRCRRCCRHCRALGSGLLPNHFRLSHFRSLRMCVGHCSGISIGVEYTSSDVVAAAAAAAAAAPVILFRRYRLLLIGRVRQFCCRWCRWREGRRLISRLST